LADDGLNKILSKGIGLNHFFGLDPSLSHGYQILYLQYDDDDTLLFLKTDTNMLEHIKWALKGFEGILELKTNFAKSELILLNLSESETITSAFILQCKISTLP
jgi:hypothetical protein